MQKGGRWVQIACNIAYVLNGMTKRKVTLLKVSAMGREGYGTLFVVALCLMWLLLSMVLYIYTSTRLHQCD